MYVNMLCLSNILWKMSLQVQSQIVRERRLNLQQNFKFKNFSLILKNSIEFT